MNHYFRQEDSQPPPGWTPEEARRKVVCVDMDAFFASVEQRANPALRGKPIGVIGSGARTVITTASYEARKWGVKTGMNVFEARRACPPLILVEGDNRKYTHTCSVLSEFYRRFSPEIEIYSIDEAFIEITGSAHIFGGPLELGKRIKEGVHSRFGINCTVGIGPNILTAKLASDRAKPDGLLMLEARDLGAFLEDLPVDELWGIGKKTARKLERIGVRTCGQLGRTPPSLLRSKFGIVGETLAEMGRGRLDRELITGQGEPKSIGHSQTLPGDISDRRLIEKHLLRLSEMVARRARTHGYLGRRIGLTLRYSDFVTISRQGALGRATNDPERLHAGALGLLSSLGRLRDRVRLLGVTLGDLEAEAGQLHLIEHERRRRELLGAMDEVNGRYGEFTLTWGGCLEENEPSRVISPAWRPEGVRNTGIAK